VIRKSLQVLHSQERRTIVLSDFINRAEAGMIQRGCGARPALKPLQRLRIAGQFFGQKLQRDRRPIWPTLSLVFPIKFQPKDAASIANRKAESVFPCRVFDTHAAASISSRPIDEVNPFEKYKGVLKSFRSRKEINAWISDMRGSETRERRKNRDVCAGN
jgi:hypothetical protein